MENVEFEWQAYYTLTRLLLQGQAESGFASFNETSVGIFMVNAVYPSIEFPQHARIQRGDRGFGTPTPWKITIYMGFYRA